MLVALVEPPSLFFLLEVAETSGLGADSGVMDPLVPDRSICLLPPLSFSACFSSSSGELSGEQAVTLRNDCMGLGSDGLLYEPEATS